MRHPLPVTHAPELAAGGLSEKPEERGENSLVTTATFSEETPSPGTEYLHIMALLHPAWCLPPYQLDGTVEARGHCSPSGQFAEVRSSPNIEGLLEVEHGVRHLWEAWRKRSCMIALGQSRTRPRSIHPIV